MKRLLLWAALAATLIAMYFAPEAEDSTVVTVAKPLSRPPSTSTGSAATAEKSVTNKSRSFNATDLQIIPRKTDQDMGNVFDSKTWVVPALVSKTTVKSLPQLPPTVQAPQAPPLPFKYMGRWVENEITTYFLLLNEQNLALKIGDTIDGLYKLESSNGGTLTFQYLPLNQKQTLVVGEAN